MTTIVLKVGVILLALVIALRLLFYWIASLPSVKKLAGYQLYAVFTNLEVNEQKPGTPIPIESAKLDKFGVVEMSDAVGNKFWTHMSNVLITEQVPTVEIEEDDTKNA